MKYDRTRPLPSKEDSLTEGALNKATQKGMHDEQGFVEPFSTGEKENSKNDEPDLEDGPDEKEPKKRPRDP
jgi:hypothetical protein